MVQHEQALEWLGQTIGMHLDYDGVHGQQCFDYFNYYYEYITGRKPYGDG